MLIIFRKSSNANAFGQHKYQLVDTATHRVLTVNATENMPIGKQAANLAALGEHTMVNAGYYVAAQGQAWEEFMHEVVYRATDIPRWRAWREAHPLPKKNNKQRMNPARRALMTALRQHGSGYCSSRGDQSSCLDYDVSLWMTDSFDALLHDVLKEVPPMFKGGVPELGHTWWDSVREEWDQSSSDIDQWVTEQMIEYLDSEVDYYAINPRTGMQHSVEVALAGRGGKHLLVTSFDGKTTPAGLLDELMNDDRTNKDRDGVPYVRQYGSNTSAGYTNQWMRDFAEMITYWNGLDTTALARASYRHEVVNMLVDRIADKFHLCEQESARQAALDSWFTVTTKE